MRAKLRAMPHAVAAEKSSRACRAVIALPEFQAAGVVMIYIALAEELDPAEIAEEAWRRGKIVLAPRVDWKHWKLRRMSPVRIRSLSSGLHRASYGLLEPVAGRSWPVARIDLVVVPGLAFDPAGNRLGRGAGFYDRFLARPQLRAATCGLTFSEQLCEQVPMNEHDRPVEVVVTDAEVLRLGRVRSGTDVD